MKHESRCLCRFQAVEKGFYISSAELALGADSKLLTGKGSGGGANAQPFLVKYMQHVIETVCFVRILRVLRLIKPKTQGKSVGGAQDEFGCRTHIAKKRGNDATTLGFRRCTFHSQSCPDNRILTPQFFQCFYFCNERLRLRFTENSVIGIFPSWKSQWKTN